MENVPFPSRTELINGTRYSRIPAGQLATVVGITRQHMTRLCRAGKIPGARQTKGGHWRIIPSQKLATWVQHFSKTGFRAVSDREYFELGTKKYELHWKAAALRRAERAIERRLQRIFEAENAGFLEKLRAQSVSRSSRQTG